MTRVVLAATLFALMLLAPLAYASQSAEAHSYYYCRGETLDGRYQIDQYRDRGGGGHYLTRYYGSSSWYYTYC